jgi:hypothetical protein
MKDLANVLEMLVLAGVLGSIAPAQAETTLSDFNEFNLDGLFSSWASATVVSATNGYSIAASGFGSGFKGLNPNVDATGETNLELTVTLSGTGGANTPISGPIVSLVDADGTFYNWAWYGQTSGTHVLQASLGKPTFVSAAGSVAGLDLSNLAFFHLQDDPGAYSGQYTINFKLLRLTGAPALRITSQSFDPTSLQLTLTWSSKAGKSYTILYAADLSSAFSPLSTGVVSGGSSTSTTVTMPSGNSGFVRIQQE